MYLYICIRSTYHIGNLNRKIYEYNVYKFSTNASRRRNQPDAFSIPKRKRELTFSPPPFIRTSNKSLTVKKKKSRLTSLYFQECSFKRLTTLHFKHPPPPPFSLDSLHSRNSLHNSSTLSPPDFLSPLTIPSPIPPDSRPNIKQTTTHALLAEISNSVETMDENIDVENEGIVSCYQWWWWWKRTTRAHASRKNDNDFPRREQGRGEGVVV